MNKFIYVPKPQRKRVTVSVNVTPDMYDRMVAACKKLGIVLHSGRREGSSMQEMIRQMIDHCLNEIDIREKS